MIAPINKRAKFINRMKLRHSTHLPEGKEELK
jgi:hypothetical protein